MMFGMKKKEHEKENTCQLLTTARRIAANSFENAMKELEEELRKKQLKKQATTNGHHNGD